LVWNGCRAGTRSSWTSKRTAAAAGVRSGLTPTRNRSGTAVQRVEQVRGHFDEDLGGHAWIVDRRFDLARHVFPGPSALQSAADVRHYVEAMFGRRLAWDRPLWELHVLSAVPDAPPASSTAAHEGPLASSAAHEGLLAASAAHEGPLAAFAAHEGPLAAPAAHEGSLASSETAERPPASSEDVTLALLRVHPCVADGTTLVRVLCRRLADVAVVTATYRRPTARCHYGRLAYTFNAVRALFVGTTARKTTNQIRQQVGLELSK